MRVAIVGYGYMGEMYANLVKEKEWELIGVHDIDNSTFKSDKFFKSRQELISHPDVDAVIICTPHDQHLQIVKECLKQKKNVILEKPMGSSLKETKQIYKKIKKHTATSCVVVNITHCFYDNIQKAKEKIGELDVQRITSIRDSVVFPIRESERNWWLFKKERVGHGVMLTNGCHLLARILHLFSDHSPRYEVQGGIWCNQNKLGDIDDSLAHMRVDLVLNNNHRIPVRIFANWPMTKSAEEHVTESMEVHGDHGLLHIQAWNEVRLYANGEEKVSQTVPYNRDTIAQELAKGVKNVLNSFEQAVDKKEAKVHHSVEHTFQAEMAIGEYYAKCQKRAYESQNQSRLIQSLDCAIAYGLR